MFISLLLAFSVGFAVSFFTVGPTTIMAIRRMCTHGFVPALMIGLGSALADGMYAAIPAFGLRGIAEQLEFYRSYIQIGGALLLIAFGLFFVFWKKPVERKEHTRKADLGSFGTGWLLNIINPGNALAFTFALTFFGLLSPGMTLGTSLGYTLAILIGSAVAWLIKVVLIYLIGKERLNEDNLNQVTYWMGWLSVVVGVILILYSGLIGPVSLG